ncbi:MAG TPA: hypothetical protein DEP23_12090 [Ruminococcaceae bacterium]|nr:hypothetical protein [Oscillospiraceae bacterium]
MLFPEEKKVYETKIKSTKYFITSESLPDTREDILDSFSRLMDRDCGTVFDPKANLQNRIPTQEEAERFKKVWDAVHSPIQWDTQKSEGD